MVRLFLTYVIRVVGENDVTRFDTRFEVRQEVWLPHVETTGSARTAIVGRRSRTKPRILEACLGPWPGQGTLPRRCLTAGAPAYKATLLLYQCNYL